MTLLRIAILCGLVGLLSACGGYKEPRFLSYDGPQVTRVVVFKEARQMQLFHGNTMLRAYPVALGREPLGHKARRGDARTPEGTYVIDRRNPRSSYHLSIGLDYPNEDDMELATRMGWDPGGDIFIHGRGPLWSKKMPDDWTYGCIAVTDEEIEEIYAMVGDGTPITIFP